MTKNPLNTVNNDYLVKESKDQPFLIKVLIYQMVIYMTVIAVLAGYIINLNSEMVNAINAFTEEKKKETQLLGFIYQNQAENKDKSTSTIQKLDKALELLKEIKEHQKRELSF